MVEELADAVWDLVMEWKPIAQDTVGKQLIRSADSIGANLVEGDGRYSTADSLHFFVIARASAREVKWWLHRALKRRLTPAETANELLEKLDHATRSLNSLINYRRQRAKGVREEVNRYDSPPAEHRTPNTEHLPREIQEQW